MTKRKVRYGHCYRCIYTWRMRRRSPSLCPRCKSRLWRIPRVEPRALTLRERRAKRYRDAQTVRTMTAEQSLRAFGTLSRTLVKLRKWSDARPR